LNRSRLPSRFGGIVDSFEPKAYIRPRKSIKVMSREIQLAMAAAALAWEDSGLEDADIDSQRLGVVGASDMLFGELPEMESMFRACIVDGKFNFSQWGASGMRELYPLWMLKYLPNMAACHIGISRDARGPCNSIVQGEVSSLLAVIEGIRLIQRGACDAVIVGGTGSRLHPTSLVWRYGAPLSRRNAEPPRASRPFDADRDGMVNGEGAGMLVIESGTHARRRGAKSYARLTGYGEGFQGGDSLGVTAQAIARSIAGVLSTSGWSPQDVGHVAAHGLSTPADDVVEATAIATALPETPVTAAKGNFGNLGAGGGTVELIACVLSVANRQVPPTLNYETPDPQCPIRVVARQPLETDRPTAIKLSQSRTGQAAAVGVADA
jgi:3-oxoacyl-[acyl-carrier-protein] synthase II